MISLDAGVQRLQRLTDRKSLVVAYSGGVDSQVLLHWLVQLVASYPEYSVRAVHVNHQWHPESEAWARHCERSCVAWDVGLMLRRVTLTTASKESVEAQARRLRYAQLTQALSEDDVLLTAHHENDQAETLLLQCLRGAGVKGMSAMPMTRLIDGALFLRPLLDQSQSAFYQYAQKHQLTWVEDTSNDDERFDRNFIRHQVLPVLTERWPSVVSSLARSAQHCASASRLIDEQAALDALSCVIEPDQLNMAAWHALSDERGMNVLRHWLEAYGCTLPSTQLLHRMVREVMLASDDAQPCCHWGQWSCRRYQRVLYVMPELKSHDSAQVTAWDLREDLDCGDIIGILSASRPELVALAQHLDRTEVTVRFRQGGETIRLAGQRCTQTLKNLFQQWRVPPWQRDRIPLLFEGECCVMVWGYGVAQDSCY